MSAARDNTEFEATWTSPTRWPQWLSVVNNQPLGKRYMLTAGTFFFVAVFLSLLMRIQLAVPNNTFLGPQAYNEVFTMHGSTMMFLFVVPFIEGLALSLLPMIIGARDVAFPRLTAFSYWTYLFGGLIFYASFLFGSAPDGGWFAYPPLTESQYSGLGLDFWLLGLSLVEFGGIAAGAEIVVTILKLRGPGMSLARLPIFAWALLVTGAMILVAFTVLLMTSLLLELDRSAGTHFFNPVAGGSSLLWQHLFWFFGHPEVYIIFLPAAGIVSTVLPTFAKRPLAGYSLVVVAIVLMGFLSFGLWAHHMFTTGIPELSLAFFTAASLFIVLSSGVQVFSWIATVWGSRPAMRVPMLYAIGGIVLFVIGGMTGVMVSVVPFDWQVHDTYFVVAHLHYVILGGVIFPLLAGLSYWLPKWTGVSLQPKLGYWGFWLSFIGVNVTFLPMHHIGLLGLPRRVYTYPESLGLGLDNLVASIGSFVLALGFLLFALDAALAFRRGGRPAGNNPWNAGTLEWATPSPPPQYSHFEPPVTGDRYPLWAESPPDDPPARAAAAALAGAPAAWRGTLLTSVLTGAPQAVHPLPGPTYWPLFAAIGLLVGFVGVLAKLYLILPLGLAVTVVALCYWFYPKKSVLDRLRAGVPGSPLPVGTTGSRSVPWWGMLCWWGVVATALGVLIYAYFYLWLYSDAWPQGGLPQPDWVVPLLAHGALAATWLPALGAMVARRLGRLKLGLIATLPLSAAHLGLLGWHLAGVGFSWQANAFASIFYVLNWFAALIAVVGVAFTLGLLLRLRGETDARDPWVVRHVEVVAMYWFAAAAVAAATFATLYVSPIVLL